MAIWIDTPWPQDSATIKARGYAGIMRYICSDWNTGPGTSMPHKRIDRPELDGYIAAGVDVGVNFEDAADDYLGGYARGKAKGQTAGAWMLGTLDWPAGGSCCSSIDADIGVAWGDDPGQEYQRGFAEGLTSEGPYVPGIYGSAVALNGAAADGTARVFWLTAASYWSHGQDPKTVHLVQGGYWPYGGDADLDYTVTQPMGSYLQAKGGNAITGFGFDTQAHADEVYAILHNFVTKTGYQTLDTYFNVGAIGQTRISQAVQDEFATVNSKLAGLKADVAAIPAVDQAALERAVVDAVAVALAGGVPVETIEQGVANAMGKTSIPVALTGTAGVPPVPAG